MLHFETLFYDSYQDHSSSNFQKKKAYSAAALTFLAAGGAEAQVVLTDIDPDVTYSAPDGVFYLDLDNDGTEDFLFQPLQLQRL